MDVRPAAIDLDALPFPDRTLTARYRHEYFAEYMKPLASGIARINGVSPDQ